MLRYLGRWGLVPTWMSWASWQDKPTRSPNTPHFPGHFPAVLHAYNACNAVTQRAYPTLPGIHTHTGPYNTIGTRLIFFPSRPSLPRAAAPGGHYNGGEEVHDLGII